MNCKICNKEFSTNLGLVNHILKTHKMTTKEYYDRYLNDKHSNICDICGNIHDRFINLEIGYHNVCSKECGKKLNILHGKATLLKKYGIDNISKLVRVKESKRKKMLSKTNEDKKIIREKTEKTNLEKYGYKNTYQLFTDNKEIIQEKYGVDNIFQLPEIKKKIQDNYFIKYGVRYNTQIPEVKNKIKESNLKIYGCTCNLANEEQILLKKDTYLRHYGVDHYSKSEECRELRKNKQLKDYKEFSLNCEILNLDENNSSLKCKCLNCGKEFICQKQLFRHRFQKKEIQCLYCNPIIKMDSFGEKELSKYIRSIYSDEIIENDRKMLDGKELDIYLPKKKIAFEFDGIYWHSELYKDKNYHIDKTNLCLERGIQLIHIFENEWIHKQDIVKSRITSLLGISTKIYARKCECKEISYLESKEFLDENHIQGNCISKYRYGLYYNNELVSLMTFGKSRFKDEFELLRFCNKKYENIIGGASKLFFHFLKDHEEINEIISYADRRWSIGNLYQKLRI